MLVEIFQNTLAFGQNKFPTKVLSIVPSPFPEKAFSVACQQRSHKSPVPWEGSENRAKERRKNFYETAKYISLEAETNAEESELK